MICSYCGTECDGLPDGPEVRDDDKFIIHGLARCRDALKDQLASMTKRAEESEREKTELLDTILTPEDYAKSSQDLWAQAVQADKERDAAEAKLATAAEGFVSIKSYLNDNPGKNALGVVTNRWVSDVCNYALRALGIDPSKEKNK